jgi:Rha family phage regulatory protein
MGMNAFTELHGSGVRESEPLTRSGLGRPDPWRLKMENQDMFAMNAERQPVVTVKDGEVFASSRDVAAFFEKEHRHVLRDIDGLIRAEPDLALRGFSGGGVPRFGQTPYVEPSTGQTYRLFEMTRDGFMLLAMGFTGSKALKWKMRYIEAFNIMEDELRKRPAIDPMQVLSDPAAMRGLLLTYVDQNIALQKHNAELAPKAEALERIAEANGTFIRATAAKMLGIPPQVLNKWMRTNGWTFKRPGCPDDIAYQSKIALGLLEHKIDTGMKGDGTIWTSTQVRVTPKGLTVLAQAFPPVARAT